ncbi:MAG: hypothetical protein E7562_01945 [Ruminococcaceae bacterium]|nr:hypothetical protein [Oscillospiraceae bacterium]
MFGFGKRKKDKQDNVLCEMDGREVKYVTRRIKGENGDVKEMIVGKKGRIVVIDGEIRIMCGETDVFRCMAENATYYTLLSGDGITVSGVNSINGEQMDMIVYYSYYRK